MEVTPELIADIGTKKGEKVDYAILKDGKPIILFECKKSGGDLSVNHASQLFRYFHVTEARFGVLTNGLVYRFFTDLDQPNKMDEKPFLEFNILDFRDQDVEELTKFAKTAFNVDTILTTANELKYTRLIQNQLAEWMVNPSEEFVRLVSAGFIKVGKKNQEQFTHVTKRAFQQLISDRINERLKVAMTPELVEKIDVSTVLPTVTEVTPELDSQQTETTEHEIEGFHIVKSILREVVGAKRIVMRDALSYCAVLFDNNNRKPICRFYFNNPEKLFIGLFNGKEIEKVALDDLDAIYNLADKLKATVTSYV